MQLVGGWQGQDGKWSTLYHECLPTGAVAKIIHNDELPRGSFFYGLRAIDDNFVAIQLPRSQPQNPH